MRYLAVVLALAMATASCQTRPQEPTVASGEDSPISPTGENPAGDLPPVPGQLASLTLTLTEVTQRPSPVGLPSEFVISPVRLPEPGSGVEVTWQAADGDPERPPRDGAGQLLLSSDGAGVTLSLTASGKSEEEALTLEGTIDDAEIRGTFSDRLFYPRAGMFRAEIREEG